MNFKFELIKLLEVGGFESTRPHLKRSRILILLAGVLARCIPEQIEHMTKAVYVV